MSDLFDKAMFTQALNAARDLAAGLAGQNLAEVAVTESVDGEFTTSNGAEQVEIIAVKEIETSISSVVVASGSADMVKVVDGVRGVIDGREEFDVAGIAGRHDL